MDSDDIKKIDKHIVEPLLDALQAIGELIREQGEAMLELRLTVKEQGERQLEATHQLIAAHDRTRAEREKKRRRKN